jgi:hypothetical protein
MRDGLMRPFVARSAFHTLHCQLYLVLAPLPYLVPGRGL